MYPKLTKEEFKSLKIQKKEFFVKYNLVNKIPLYRQIAMSIQDLALKKAMKGEIEEAIRHHFKACIYYPEIGISMPNFRKMVGLPAFNK